ncbi:Vacuolar protein sorting-associated protein 11 like [Verticillium longisporum]|nr:Vacuolar protein sorting-associated protein 11 like [Verticillium longisporum]
MSIKPLPPEAVKQIRSSVVITSLNEAIVGLIQNSLDAKTRRINITVDYSRGNCVVEDDGEGIPPHEFSENGGLGRLHHTSRYPRGDDTFGAHGDFIASLAALSLFSITSHHRSHKSHNTLTFRNAELLVRNTPAKLEHQIQTFGHGTRASVRDLFGNMAVRVKQRPSAMDKTVLDRDFNSLVHDVVALSLACAADVNMHLRDSGGRNTVRLRPSPADTSVNDPPTRISRMLVQSGLAEDVSYGTWVAVSGSTSSLSVKGSISLNAVATRQAQFISFGIHPMPGDQGYGSLYEDANRVFANSDFEIADFSESQSKDTIQRKDLKSKRGLERWPMFSFRVESTAPSPHNRSFEDILEQPRRLSQISDLIKIVCFEFLKKHQFRPRTLSSGRNLKRQASRSDSTTIAKRVKSASSSKSRSRTSTPVPRTASPFDLWERVKVGKARQLMPKLNANEAQSVPLPLVPPDTVLQSDRVPGERSPFVDKEGRLLQKPFDEIGLPPSLSKQDSPGLQSPAITNTPEEAAEKPSDENQCDVHPSDTRPLSVQTGGISKIFSKSIRLGRDKAHEEPSEWLRGLLGSWENPVFPATEAPIYRMEEVTATAGTEVKCGGHGLGSSSVEMSSIKLQGQLSKQSLRDADVVAQVDNKFILVKLRQETSSKFFCEEGNNTMLVIVDQHAADERCKLETLMKGYFVLDSNAVLRAETVALSAPLTFELSSRECELLRRRTNHFENWGITYIIRSPAQTSGPAQLSTLDVRSLPPSILKRCIDEPKLLADLLRHEVWRLEEEGPRTPLHPSRARDAEDWVSNFQGCPPGILDMLNSRSCRSAIMFNDVLSLDQGNVAMAISWRAFDFFDVSRVRLADDETRLFVESNDISKICSGSDSLFLGSYDGYVRIVGASWKIVRSFQAHDAAITHMRQIEGTSLLLTIAEDLSNEPVLKVWALDKLVKKTNMPTCLSTLRINNGKKQFPISALTALDDLSQIAVGFANGTVTVIRGDLINDLGAKQRIMHESEEPVTGVELIPEPSNNSITLFVSTTARILKLSISKKGHGYPPKTVEDVGCDVGCMTLDKRTEEVVVARDDAIYTYTVDGRGPPKAYESPKKSVAVYGDYTALVCPPSSAVKDKQPDSMRRRFGGAADALFNASTFVLLEADLRLIGHTESLISPFRALFQIWGDLFVMTQDGKVHRYHEKTLQQKLELLFQRNMYPLAIDLAKKSGMDEKQRTEIFRRFGDHLYQKADYDGAMVQYIKAIDTTEPSQVIRKFLDTQRIHNLIQYLEQLHEHRKATSDHTTLLLNCYAKLKDIDKLEKFIKSPGDLKFDLETAISMCRQGGYYEQAAYLAKQHGEIDLVVDILIEDSKQYEEALDFIWRQDPEVAYPCLKKYARNLIEHCPKEATSIFVDYYTGKFRPRIGAFGGDTTGMQIIQVQDNDGNTSSRLVAGVAGAASAVQNLTNLLPLPYMNSAAVATPDSQENGGKTNGNGTVILDPEDIPAPKYTPPPPRTAFSSFIDHPDEFIVFLEACLKEKELKHSDRTDLYTTLFEMYLSKSNEKRGEQHKEEWENKAKKLIEGQDIPMESSNVLLLSHLSDFPDGTRLVKEQSGLLFDIFRSYTAAKDTRGAIRALRKYGSQEPQLYPAALAYLTSDPRILKEAGPDELAGVLGKIDKDGLMAPLQVIQTLVGSSGGGVATMGMIKPYLHETIERERQEIASNRRRIAAFRTETDQKRGELADIGSKPAVFQATRCADCGQQLDLPAVHFLCKHSFHQRCLRGGGAEGDSECPQCAKDNATIRALRATQVETAGKHELFRAELERSDDRFATVADWFGRGVMGAPAADA